MTDTNKKPIFGGKIAEITRRYKTPRIKATPGVKIALMALRIYLVLLVALIAYKFITLL